MLRNITSRSNGGGFGRDGWFFEGGFGCFGNGQESFLKSSGGLFIGEFLIEGFDVDAAQASDTLVDDALQSSGLLDGIDVL